MSGMLATNCPATANPEQIDADSDGTGDACESLKIAFQSMRDGNPEIYVMNADGSDPKRLTIEAADDYTPVFSPDGEKIAFTSERDGDQEIYIMNPDGTDQVNLTINAADDRAPDFQPGR